MHVIKYNIEPNTTGSLMTIDHILDVDIGHGLTKIDALIPVLYGIAVVKPTGVTSGGNFALKGYYAP